jgi:hypothetical protein
MSDSPQEEPVSTAVVPFSPVETAVETPDEQPRVRIEQWAGSRERTLVGRIELLMVYVAQQEAVGHIIDHEPVFEQQFQDFCDAPV